MSSEVKQVAIEKETNYNETKPLLHHHIGIKKNPKQKQSKRCFPSGKKYRLIAIKDKGPIVFIAWNALLSVTLSFQLLYAVGEGFNQMLSRAISISFFPIIGWLADVKVGRYTIMKASLLLLFFSNILLITHRSMAANSTTSIPSGVFYAGSVLLYLALSCYTSSFLQSVTDQQFEASLEELSFTIYWILWSILLAAMIGIYANCVASEVTTIISLASSLTSWLMAVIVLVKYRHLVVMAPLNPNPIKQIARVLWYAWKHKYPTRRSALTYWEEDYPSRIDLGKSKYGGHFTFEEVEDVKIVLRLIPLLLVISLNVGLSMVFKPEGKYVTVSIYCGLLPFTTAILLSCFIVGLPIYHFIIYPLFYNYIPTILQRLQFGMFLVVMFYLIGAAVSVVGAEQIFNAACQMNSFDKSAINAQGDWMAFPLNIILAFGFIITLISTVEFVYAQTPHQIKSFVMQMAFMFIISFSSLGDLVNITWLYFPGQYFPGCVFYFYLLHSIITLTSFILFLIIAKRYKLRIREDIVPYDRFAEDFVDSDIRRREVFWMQKESQYEALK